MQMKARPWARAIYNLLAANQTALDVDNVWYGDQEKLPTGRSICAEPYLKENRIKGAAWVADQDFEAHIYVYVTKIQSPMENRDECDILAEQIEDLIHANKTMNNTCISCWVSKIEFGYSTKDTGIVRSARLVIHGKGQSQLIPEGG